MKKEQTRVLNNATKWASTKSKMRSVSVEWSTPWHEPDSPLKFTVSVADNDLSQFGTLPDNFTGDISTFLCQQKQESLQNELETLTERIARVKLGCK